MSRRRQRRAASLTAEALWNIQLQDEIGKKKKLDSNEDEDDVIMSGQRNPGQSSYMAASKMENLTQKLTSKSSKVAAGVSLPTPKEKPRTGGQAVLNSNISVQPRTSNVYRNKGKLTASVAPLVKPVKNSQEHQSSSFQPNVNRNIAAVTGTSPVLLLPISLDASENPIRSNSHTLPLLTLHASPLKVDLVHCFDRTPQIIVPSVTVSSLLSGTYSNHHPHSSYGIRSRQSSYERPLSPAVSSAKHKTQSASDQTEPLNLKLGESSIPSHYSSEKAAKSMLKIKKRHLSNYASQSAAGGRSRPATSGSVRAECSPIVKRFASGIGVNLGRIDSVSRPTDILQSDSFSPSSDSSSSCDQEDDSRRRAAGGKNQINLRCKAAPPPHLRHSVVDLPHVRIKNELPRKRRRLSSESLSGSSNGWQWEGKPYEAYVYSVEKNKPIRRQCYPAVRRKSDSKESGMEKETNDDDSIYVHDCVMMRADGDQQPYVAKVAALWRHPLLKTVMISLLWYYRPEHTEDQKVLEQLDGYNDDELFASKHLDEISIECVEDKCHVLTYSQYCRYVATSEKRDSHVGLVNNRALIPGRANKEVTGPVYFCRKLYDIKMHRLLKTLPPTAALFSFVEPTVNRQIRADDALL